MGSSSPYRLSGCWMAGRLPNERANQLQGLQSPRPHKLTFHCVHTEPNAYVEAGTPGS